MKVGYEGGFEGGFSGEMIGGAAGKLVMAFEAVGAASAGELVEAVEVERVKGVAGGGRQAPLSISKIPIYDLSTWFHIYTAIGLSRASPACITCC